MNHLGLFSGIGGFEEAFRRAGANLIAACEIDQQAQKVLRRHFPGTRIINDVKAIKKDTFGGIPIDLITGGFPCQDLSVAGCRKGLDGERSGLWFEYLRIIDLFRPRWVEIENVPGLLSSNGGEDFAVILRGLVELGYGVAWRVFDSQFDGVAQRRERVFIVASLGTASCAEVLFEREGGARDYPPSREAGEGVANAVTTGSGKSCGPRNGHGHPLNLITGTLSARQTAAGGLGTDFECMGGLQPFGLVGRGEYAERPATLRAEGGDCGGGSEHLIAFGGNNTRGPIDVATACNAHGGPSRHDFESETFLVAPKRRSNGDNHSGYTTGDGLIIEPQISHALTSEGADASEDGTGRGTPIIAYPIQEISKRTGVSTDDIRCGLGIGEDGAPMYTLQLGAQHGVVAFTERTRAEGRNLETQDELAYALTNPGSGGRTHSRQIAGSFGVRRLTPRECERLQGFPDDWTRYGDDEKEISDSARYRMLGNAVCLPTVEWIARRIIKEDKS